MDVERVEVIAPAQNAACLPLANATAAIGAELGSQTALPAPDPSPTLQASIQEERAFRTRAWMFIVALALVDIIWARFEGLTFAGCRSVLLTVGFLAVIGIYYDRSGRNARLADVGNYAALWVALSAAGAVFTYVVATMRMPLQDVRIAQLDQALGFHWEVWWRYIHTHRLVAKPLAIAYETMLPQIIGSILFFAHTERTERNRELLSIAMVSLVLTTLISGFFPATGPFMVGHQPLFARVLLQIRAGATNFALDHMQGIVTMPSYHTVTAILLIYVHRPPARSFPLLAVLNLLMLLSVPFAGNHYLSDLIAGSIMAAICIALDRWMVSRQAAFTLG